MGGWGRGGGCDGRSDVLASCDSGDTRTGRAVTADWPSRIRSVHGVQYPPRVPRPSYVRNPDFTHRHTQTQTQTHAPSIAAM